MSETFEKRGPVEKSDKGWPLNPIGVVILIIFAFVILFLIVRPLTQRQTIIQQDKQIISEGGSIISPSAGAIIKENELTIDLSVDNESNVSKVQFWAKTYADGKWQMIGEVEKAPYSLKWKIPNVFHNRAIAITTHILMRDDQIIKDPGGWREGIIILSE